MAFRRPLSPQELSQKINEIAPLKQGFDLLQDHAIITDANANILYANNAVLRQTGFSPEEVLGMNPGDLWGGNMPKEFYSQMWHTIKVLKEPYIGAIRNTTKDGTERWQEIIISPVLSKTEEVRFFIGIEPDISDRVKAEKFQKEFVSILAHQLQNPLGSIRWSLELLMERGGLTKKQKDMIENIYKSNALLIDMVADLLVLARIGQPKLEPTEIDLKSEIEDAIAQTKKKYPFVEWKLEIERSYPLTVSSPALVRQIFINLINNAAKFADSQAGQVRVSLKSDKEGYLFTVANNGASIPGEEHSQIFTRLFQGTTSKLTQKPGSGLGLYICKQICDSLGWEVSFQSPNSEGWTEFRVVIKKA